MPGFSASDCELISKYAADSWLNVPKSDQEGIRDIRQRLSAIAKRSAANYSGSVKVRDFVSHPNPSGRAARLYWSCVYPAEVPNKSFGLQFALIIRPQGAELAFCLGAEKSSTTDPSEQKRERLA